MALRGGAKMAIKQGDIPECLILETFLSFELVPGLISIQDSVYVKEYQFIHLRQTKLFCLFFTIQVITSCCCSHGITPTGSVVFLRRVKHDLYPIFPVMILADLTL